MHRLILAAACAVGLAVPASAQTAADPHAGHGAAGQAAPAAASAPRNANLPPDANAATEQLKTSPRHGEWVDIKNGTGPAVKSFVVYPERKDKAPVVIVIHEIFGLTRLGARRCRSTRERRLHRDCARLPLGQGSKRGRKRFARRRRGTGDSRAPAGRHQRDPRRGACVCADDPVSEQEGRRRLDSAGEARPASGTRSRSRN